MPMTDGTLPRRVLAQQLLRLRTKLLLAIGLDDKDHGSFTLATLKSTLS
jgi:hypothetical protein